MREEHTDWPPLKLAIWRVVTSENLNDGHYVKARELTEKLFAAVSSAPTGPFGYLVMPDGLREDDWRISHDPETEGCRSFALHLSPADAATVDATIDGFRAPPKAEASS